MLKTIKPEGEVVYEYLDVVGRDEAFARLCEHLWRFGLLDHVTRIVVSSDEIGERAADINTTKPTPFH